jgi:hypothetical protein
LSYDSFYGAYKRMNVLKIQKEFIEKIPEKIKNLQL